VISLLVTLATLLLSLRPSLPPPAPTPPPELRPAPAPVAPPAAGMALSYSRPLGQIARYHMTVEARGEQISLDEHIPVKWQAEIELTEEVIARGQDGSLWLRVKGGPIAVKDGNSVFASGMMNEWPQMDLHVSRLGEVLEASPSGSAAGMGERERAFVALAAQPPTIMLPDRNVQPGDEWQWEREGARQVNRLVSVTGAGDTLVANLSSSGAAPLRLEESDPRLGIATRMTGNVTYDSKAGLLVAQGLVQRHKGEMRLRTKSETTLDTAEGRELFEMESELTVAFEVRLVGARDPGRPAGAADRDYQ